MAKWRRYYRELRSVCNAGDVNSSDTFLMTMITEGVISNKGGELLKDFPYTELLTVGQTLLYVHR